MNKANVICSSLCQFVDVRSVSRGVSVEMFMTLGSDPLHAVASVKTNLPNF
jgi:hypothetical protein